MSLFVQKYGGTSVGSIDRINAVADRIIHTLQQGHRVVAVVSAMSGETNRLIDLAHQLEPNPSSRELDMLVTTGEQVSAAMLSMALMAKGYPAISLLADQIGIRTDSQFGKARIQSIQTDVINEHIEHGRIVIAAGFQGRDAENNVTSLGRGGTDTTAVALAAAIGAEECQIFTDVDGVYTTDPRIEPKAKKLKTVLFDEMIEMASLGAKVLQKRSVELAGKYQVKLRVLSSFEPLVEKYDLAGTLITYEENELEQLLVSGIACTKDEAIISLSGLDPTTVLPADVLHAVAECNIEVDMIVQAMNHDKSQNKLDFAFTVAESDYEQTMTAIHQLLQENQNISIDNVQGHKSVAKISVVGVGMRSHAGVASRVLKALAKEHIPIELISTSEIKVSVLIESKYMELAVRTLHQAFELHT